MKVTNVKPRLIPQMRNTLSVLWQRRAVRLSLRCAAAFFSAFLLSAVPLGGGPLPLAAALILSVEFFPYSLLSALGALAGYALCWPWALALEPIAVTVLLFAGAGLFHDVGLQDSDWFAPVLSMALTAAVGFVFLLDQGLSALHLALFAAKLAFAGAAPMICRRALAARDAAARGIAALALFVGFASMAPPVSGYLAVGAGYAIAIATGRSDILPTLLCGLGLDLTGALPLGMSAPMAAAALCCRMLPNRQPLYCSLTFVGVNLAWQLMFGMLSLPLTLACALGSGLGLLLPKPRLSVPHSISLPSDDAELPLRKISKVFAMMHRELTGPAKVASQSEIADVYDATAETVCRLCVRSHICWEQEAERTYEDLCAAAAPILQRGSAVREDFPPAFSESCCHMEGFITAVNQELEANRCRRQLRNRLRESRGILASQYLFLSRFLGRLADEGSKPPTTRTAFTPEFAVSTACRPGASVCGDRGASFRDRWNHFYVLLCDGMGTGEQAARESGRAVRTLTGLLESGVAPDSAMELLNGFYVLQENSAFSTVDLVQIDLTTGTGVLYKWGAAPSYLKSGETVKKIGTASPPPGLSVGSEHTAEQLKLSLKDGETLIMVSDGAFGEATEQRAAHFRGSGARELAGYLIAGLREHSEDDLTAAVLSLLPEAS